MIEACIRRTDATEKHQGHKEVFLHVTAGGEDRLRRGLQARAIAIRALPVVLSESEQDQLGALVGKALAGSTRRRDEADIACRLCGWAACTPACPVDASAEQTSGS